jgi:hypothetical protein
MFLRYALILLIDLMVAGSFFSVHAQTTVNVTNSDSGWYRASDGFHDPNNRNYLTQGSFANSSRYHGWLSFDIPSTSTIISARLRVYTWELNGTNNLRIWDVSTPISTLRAGGTGLSSIFNDLGSGTNYASRNISSADSDITISLNAQAVAALNAARGAEFALGFSTGAGQFIFSRSGSRSNRLILTVADATPPVVTPQANITVEATGPTTPVALGTATATDNVDGAITPTPSTTGPFPVGTTTITWSATDNAGNTGTATQTVTVTDTTAPAISVPTNIVVNTDSGSPTAVVSYTVTATDLVDGSRPVSLTGGLASGSAFPIGTTTVTHGSTDTRGNSSTASFTVTVNDNEAPGFVPVPNITINTDAGQATAVVSFTAPTATDNSGVVQTLTQTAGPASGSAFPVGTTQITYRATDPSGNASTVSFNVIVTDNEAPVLTVPGNIVQNTDPGLATAAVTYAVSATDNVNGALTPTRTAGIASGGNFPIGVTTVTHTVQDTAGNVTTKSFTVTVTDNEAPVLPVLANIVTNNDPGQPTAAVTYATPTATDNAPGVTVAQTAGPASGSAFPIGTTPVTFTATDAAGNTATRTFNVVVSDGEPPGLVVSANIVQSTDPGLATAVVNYPAPTASDNAPGVTVARTAGPASGSAFPLGVTTVTFVATDAANNTVTQSFTVTVQDTEPPVVTTPANIAVTTDAGQPTAVLTFTATATDNDGIASLTSSPPSGTAFPIGTTTVTVTAVDNAGLTTTANFTVTVTDNEAPVLTVSPDITVNTDPGKATANVTYPAPTATDNAPGVTIARTAGPASGSDFPIGATTVTHVATDVAGNTTTESFVVTVNDAAPPVIVGLPSDIAVTVDFPETSATVSFKPPTVTDNAPGATVAQIAGPASGSSFPLGDTTVTYRATDASGNVVDASFKVTVTQTPPGTIVLAVTADVSDGTIRFRSPEPGLNQAVTTSGGRGRTSAIRIRPGRYKVQAFLPDGFGLTDVRCNDNDSSGNVGSRSAVISLASQEAVTCTFSSADSRTKTTQAIGAFLQRRNDLLLSSEPGAQRQIERLQAFGRGAAQSPTPGDAPTGAPQLGGPRAPEDVSGQNGSRLNYGASGLGSDNRRIGFSGSVQNDSRARQLALGDDTGHQRGANDNGNAIGSNGPGAGSDGGLDINVSGSLSGARKRSVSTKRTQLMGLLGAEQYRALGAERLVKDAPPSPFDVWFEGSYTAYDDDSANADGSGHFSAFYLGADFVVSPNLLVGMLVQLDDMKETSLQKSTRIHGRGWMVGPYATLKLTENLYFQGRAAWGQSRNRISPFLTYTDTFETERWLVRGKLQGLWSFGQWRFTPNASLAYIEERQAAYIDTLRVLIPGQTVSLGQAEFGPEAAYVYTGLAGFVVTPSIGLKGVWTFAEDNGAVVGGSVVGSDDIRGKLEAGLTIKSTGGVSLEISGTYDGITDQKYEAIEGGLRLRVPLQ